MTTNTSNLISEGPKMVTPHDRPEKFKGNDFKTWQSKMLFYLTTIGMARFLIEECPTPKEGQTLDKNKEIFLAIESWKNSDFLCRNYILNSLDEVLYKVYSPLKTSKLLWEALDKKYRTEDAGLKKFVVEKFMNFNMINGKSVMEQIQEIQIILHEIVAEGHIVSESFQVAAIIGKLPPGWKDFRNYLKHKRKEMSLEDLIVRLKIEEDNRGTDKKGSEEMHKVHVVENSNRKKSLKRKAPSSGMSNNKGKKFKGTCFSCGKKGHIAKECRSKKNEPHQANLTEEVTKDISDMHLSAVVSQVNMVCNTKDWWVDTGATSHICSERNLFSTYTKVDNGQKLFMGNAAISDVEGTGQVILKFTSGKSITLNDVLHVPTITKNLISGSILSKKGFKMVFESDKFVLTKGGMFVGKGYLVDGLFKANVAVVDKNEKFMYPQSINKNISSSYLIESPLLWHDRLGHVNYNKMKKLSYLGMIPKFNLNELHKCETCVEAKYAKKPFHTVEQRSTEPLGLVHTDLCDFRSTPTRGGKKYYITFIDDCTRYCYVYLLSSKDEAISAFVKYKAEVENQLDRKIKILRSDRGGEYEFPFASICAESGIIHQTTAAYSPQQNGVAERKNRTLKDMMNIMLINSGLPDNLWGEALFMANYIQNRVPHKKIGNIPYELWKGRKPNYKYLKVWGCLAKVSIPPPKRTKLGPKTVDCYFLGNAENSSSYRFLVFKSDVVDISVNTIIESRDAEFFENIFPHKRNHVEKRTHDISEETDQPLVGSENSPFNEEPRRS